MRLIDEPLSDDWFSDGNPNRWSAAQPVPQLVNLLIAAAGLAVAAGLIARRTRHGALIAVVILLISLEGATSNN